MAKIGVAIRGLTAVGNMKVMATTKGRPVIPIVVAYGTGMISVHEHLILLVQMVF